MLRYLLNLFKLQKLKRNKPNIKHLYVSESEPLASKLIDAAAKHQYISSVNLSYNDSAPSVILNSHINFIRNSKAKKIGLFLYKSVSEQIMKVITESLKQNSTLSQLELNLSSVLGEQASNFNKYLETTTSLNKLKLEGAVFEFNQQPDFSHLYAAFKKNTSLTSIAIYSYSGPSAIKDSNIDSLIEVVKQKQALKSLNIKGHQLNSASMKKLCKSLEQNKNIQSLNLSSEKLNDEQLQIVCQLIDKLPLLTSLSLGENTYWQKDDFVTEQGINLFLDKIRTNTTIKKVGIAYSDNDLLATKIANVIKQNNTLEKITLKYSKNQISQIGITHLIAALKMNTSVIEIKEGENIIVTPIFPKKFMAEMQGLLERNKLIKAIKADVRSLPRLLKQFKNATLDDTFFVAVLKILPEPFLIKYDALLLKLIVGRKSFWDLFRSQKAASTRITDIISLLSLQAQKGDDKSKAAWGYICKNGLFEQPIDPEVAKSIFEVITLSSSNNSLVREAHFEIGHLDFIYRQDSSGLISAAEHLDKVVTTDSSYFIASRLRDYSINILNDAKGINLPTEEKCNEQLENFRTLQNNKKFLNSLSSSLIKMMPNDISTQTLNHKTFTKNHANAVSENSNSPNKLFVI